MEKNEAHWLVYIHTSPSGKRYIGITGRKASERWGVAGNGYKGQSHFWNAIQKYGWQNFHHEVVLEGLTKEEAKKSEMRLIALLR